MKVIHVPFTFRPDAMGGTEVYVETLAREQQRRGVDVAIAAAAVSPSDHVDNGLPVHRFAVSAAPRLNDLYGGGDATATQQFATILDREKPDVVHLHAFTSAVSAPLARVVRQRAVRLVFTYHTPTVSCERGTLLRWGRVVCDGKLEVRRCTACTLHGHGVAPRAATLLAALPPSFGRVIGKLDARGGAWTALRMTSLVEFQQAAFRSFVNNLDRVVVLCRWTRDLLLRNCIPPEKIIVSPHGLRLPPVESKLARRESDGILRIAFLGRLHPTKGLDILLGAIARLRIARLQLDIFGITESSVDTPYVRLLRTLAANDQRVRFRPPVRSDRVVTLLQSYDILAVPSRWLETGPLVVLEAFAAGVPVVGSNLGGIAELVQDRVNGLLVEPESVESMSAALLELAQQPDLLARLRMGIQPPRRVDAVADDMQAVYEDLVEAV